jgi:hypothetical protein
MRPAYLIATHQRHTRSQRYLLRKGKTTAKQQRA